MFRRGKKDRAADAPPDMAPDVAPASFGAPPPPHANGPIDPATGAVFAPGAPDPVGPPPVPLVEPGAVGAGDGPEPLFSNEPEAPLDAPHVFEAEQEAPQPPPTLFSNTEQLANDPRLARASAAAERALSLLRTFRASCRDPIPKPLAVAI